MFISKSILVYSWFIFLKENTAEHVFFKANQAKVIIFNRPVNLVFSFCLFEYNFTPRAQIFSLIRGLAII